MIYRSFKFGELGIWEQRIILVLLSTILINTFKIKIAEHNNYKEIEFLKKWKTFFLLSKNNKGHAKVRACNNKAQIIWEKYGTFAKWTDDDPQCK